MYHTLLLMITHVWHLHANGYTKSVSYTFSINGHTDTYCVWTGIVLGFLHMPTPLRFKTILWKRYYYSCFTVEEIKVPRGIACQNCVRREFLAQVFCHSLPVPCSQDSFWGADYPVGFPAFLSSVDTTLGLWPQSGQTGQVTREGTGKSCTVWKDWQPRSPVASPDLWWWVAGQWHCSNFTTSSRSWNRGAIQF